MESTVFKKMRLKEGTSGVCFYAPKEFLDMIKEQTFIDFEAREKYDYVHLFITSKEEYRHRIKDALSVLSDNGVLWISYAKSKQSKKYDINRDSLYELAKKDGIIACGNVALNEEWTAMRFKLAASDH